MEIEEDPPAGIPEWVVTFGDMMSLLLTFFIMLVSLSEIKQEDKYQALVESMRQQFGYTKTLETLTPGDARARTSAHQVLATVGRAKKKDTAKGGTPDKAPYGEENQVRIIRPGKQTAVGTVVFFEAGSDVLTDAAKGELRIVAEKLRGKPQKIEVRGHTAPEVAARSNDEGLSMDLAYARCRVVMKYLVDVAEIEPYRFRLSSAGDSEPMHSGGSNQKLSMHSRVEVFLLDENASSLRLPADTTTPEAAAALPEEEPING